MKDLHMRNEPVASTPFLSELNPVPTNQNHIRNDAENNLYERIAVTAIVAFDLAAAAIITITCCQSDRCFSAALILGASSFGVLAIGGSCFLCLSSWNR